MKLNAAGNGLVYSTLLGGSDDWDQGYGVAVDSAGSAYVTGYTYSANFPLLGAFDATFGSGATEAFVSKLNPAGTALVYSTFLGGNGFDVAYNIEVDAAGRAVVVGESDSATFTTPLPGAYQAAGDGGRDAFVAMLNAGGTGLVYGTFLGGAQADRSQAVTLGTTGKIYVVGETASSAFDVVSASAMQASKGVGTDGFISVIDPALTGAASLVYSTFVGAAGNDTLWGVDTDSAGRIYAAGYATAAGLPTNGSAYTGGDDIYVLVLDPSVSGVAGRLYASYLGGATAEDAWAASYSNGKLYVAGNAASTSGITPAGAYDTSFNGGFDGYVAAFSFPEITTTGAALSYVENAGAVAVDPGLIVSLLGRHHADGRHRQDHR